MTKRQLLDVVCTMRPPPPDPAPYVVSRSSDWNGLARARDVLTLGSAGDQLFERLVEGDTRTTTTWRRVTSATAVTPPPRNQLAGTWRLLTSEAATNGEVVQCWAARPGGYLIFTEDMHFTDVLQPRGLPPFVCGDRMAGTDAENRAAV